MSLLSWTSELEHFKTDSQRVTVGFNFENGTEVILKMAQKCVDFYRGAYNFTIWKFVTSIVVTSQVHEKTICKQNLFGDSDFYERLKFLTYQDRYTRNFGVDVSYCGSSIVGHGRRMSLHLKRYTKVWTRPKAYYHPTWSTFGGRPGGLKVSVLWSKWVIFEILLGFWPLYP